MQMNEVNSHSNKICKHIKIVACAIHAIPNIKKLYIKQHLN